MVGGSGGGGSWRQGSYKGGVEVEEQQFFDMAQIPRNGMQTEERGCTEKMHKLKNHTIAGGCTDIYGPMLTEGKAANNAGTLP